MDATSIKLCAGKQDNQSNPLGFEYLRNNLIPLHACSFSVEWRRYRIGGVHDSKIGHAGHASRRAAFAFACRRCLCQHGLFTSGGRTKERT